VSLVSWGQLNIFITVAGRLLLDLATSSPNRRILPRSSDYRVGGVRLPALVRPRRSSPAGRFSGL
jgi:hypothetical protein